MPKIRFTSIAATFAAVVLTPFLAGCGSGASSTAAAAGTLAVRDARIDRPALPDRAAVRLVIDNETATADTLESVSSPDAERAEVHRSVPDAEGRSTMSATGALKVPAHSKVTFAPGGLHVMLTGLKQDLAVGDTIKLTFTFALAGSRTVTTEVVEPGAASGAGDQKDIERGHG